MDGAWQVTASNRSAETDMNTGCFTTATLVRQNRDYAGTRGLSANNAHLGLCPAFHDTATGRIELSRLPGGAPAPIHLLAGLPACWVLERDASGLAIAVKDTVVAGFVQGERFLTRAEAARL